MESPLPHDVLENILERLSVKTLLRFKTLSKQWNSTIESRYFQEKQLKHRQQSGDPDVRMVSVFPHHVINPTRESLRTLQLGSSSTFKIPTPWEKDNILYLVSHGSCDGLVCLYNHDKSGYVVNPTTRWYRPLPLCDYQKLMIDLRDGYYKLKRKFFMLGFGKDKFRGTYKPVWLYNSAEIGLKNATTCEVFDFSTNAWRYVTLAAPYRIAAYPAPVYLDGSLYWFTECEETKVLFFNLHTETFQVVCKAPFANVDPYKLVFCNLDNRLCVSEMKWPNQVIWSFNSGNKTWDKLCSIVLDLNFVTGICAVLPLALFDGKKKKLMFCGRVLSRTLITHDLETKSYDVTFTAESIRFPVLYFQSLISIP